MPHKKLRNAPLFPSSEENIKTAKWEEPLLPADSTVGVSVAKGGLTAATTHHHPPNAPFPAPLTDGDFPSSKDFTGATGKQLDK